MSHLDDLLAADEAKPSQEYALPSKLMVSIVEIKHGTNAKTKIKFDAIVYRVEEVLDQKLPRPEGSRNDGRPLFSQDPIEVGAQQCIYIDHRFESNMNQTTDMLAVISGVFVGEDVRNRSKLRDNEKAMAAFQASFPKNAKDDEYKTYFEGVQVILDVTAKIKDGKATGYSDYVMSSAAPF